MRNLWILPLLLLCVACGGRSVKKSAADSPKSYHFRRVLPPVHASEQDQFAYMVDHFWDRFDFADTLFIERVDSVEMIRVYAEYVAQYVGPYNGEPIRKLMQRASVSRKMLDYFVALSAKLFNDPNSPMRSDELYIPVLEAQIASPYYDKYEKMAPEYDLALASQNRIWHKANDFRFKTAKYSSNLYSLNSEYILIYINNPGCPMCRELQSAIESSQLISELIAAKRLKVLGLYPDEDISLWREHPLPSQWINGYDKGCLIEKNRLYDLRAIPSLYLLNKDKMVLVKDSYSVPQIEQAILQTLR